MEIKLNFLERRLMNFGDLLFHTGRKVKEIVYKRHDKNLIYRHRSYYPSKGILIFSHMKEES